MDKSLINKGENTRQKILQAIIQYFEEHGYAPSIRELCEMTGLKSTSSVHAHVIKMIECGMLETDCEVGASRALRVPNYKFMKIEK